MFGKNKKKSEFGDEEYQMKDNYDTSKLVIARLKRVSRGYVTGGPMIKTTCQKYIFEVIEDRRGEEIRYREVFTGFIADSKAENFNLPYVYETEKFTDYFPETEGKSLPKLSLIWILNDINFPNEKGKSRVRKK